MNLQKHTHCFFSAFVAGLLVITCLLSSAASFSLLTAPWNPAGSAGRYRQDHNPAKGTPIAAAKPMSLRGSITDSQTGSGVEAAVDLREAGGGNLVMGGMTDSAGGFLAGMIPGKTYEMMIQLMLCETSQGTAPREEVTTPDISNAMITSNGSSVTTINGRLVDYRTGKPLRFPVVVTETSKNEVVARLIPDAEGKFRLELPLAAAYKVEIQTTNCYRLSEERLLKSSTSRIDARKLTLENIYFDFDRSEIRTDALPVLTRHAELFKRFSEWGISVCGHTDNMGSEAYNTFISQKRAQAVADFLISKGVKKGQLEVVSYGFDRPVSSDQTENGRQMNRRVELIIVKY